MSFSIEETARDYIYRRFPRASGPEKEKYVNDWKNKKRDSDALVNDFKKRVADPKGKKIIDVGSGNGAISGAFARAGAIVTGLEIETELVNIAENLARSENVSVNFVLYDGDRIPFGDNSFDFANSSSVVEHTSDPVNYLKEILRVVKPEGMLYLGFPNKLSFKETHTGLWFLTYLPAFLRPAYIKYFKKNPLEDNNLHFYDYFDLERMIAKSSGGYRWTIIREEGETRNPLKKLLKKILKIFGLPYKEFLPHILVVLKKSNA